MERMDDLNIALDKSLDDMIREKKNSSRGRGRGRGRGGRIQNRGGGPSRGDSQNRPRNNSRGRFVNRNRYSGQAKYAHGGRQNNSGAPNNSNGQKAFTNREPQRRGRGRPAQQFRRTMKRMPANNGRPSNTNSNIPRNLQTKRNNFARDSRQRSPQRQNISTSGAVIVRGLLPHVTSDDIKEIFETIGVVVKAYVRFDGQTGKSTGVAEVVYAHRNDARRAQRELDGKLIDQAPITVRLALQSPLIPTRSSRGGSFNTGGRRGGQLVWMKKGASN